MTAKIPQTIKGFRDLYPQEKAVQSYIINVARKIASLFGFEEYDGPLLEPIELYLGKSSRELVEKQSFKVIDKKGNTFLMRPEITPTLARMIAQKSNSLTFPVRYFNAGLRYRYESPQKGRDREFYQMDFDIIGSDNLISDIEILAVVIKLFNEFGATEKNFTLYINSRSLLTKTLLSFGINEKKIKPLITIIDKKEKISAEEFYNALSQEGLSTKQIESILNLFSENKDYEKDFANVIKLAEYYGIEKYIKVSPSIARGLDYYTGIVFEAKSKGKIARSLVGGGRYSNLIEKYGSKHKLSGVGFAVSDSILIAFLSEMNLLPNLSSIPTKILVTIFDKKTTKESIAVSRILRENNIPCEIYLDDAVRLEKQLSFANKRNIPFVIIIGPDEIKKNEFIIKNMKTGEQKRIKKNEITKKIIKLI